MKKFLMAGAAVASLSLSMASMGGVAKAAPAVNAVINLDAIDQVSTEQVTQNAASLDIAVGGVGGSTLDSTAATVNNELTYSLSEDVSDTGYLGNGALNLSKVTQASSFVNQNDLSVIGSEGLSSTNENGLAAALNNVATYSVSVNVGTSK